jgi:hypothetical protein
MGIGFLGADIIEYKIDISELIGFRSDFLVG